jgi:hypothetical protein
MQVHDQEASYVFHSHQLNSWLSRNQNCFATMCNDYFEGDPSETFVGLEVKDPKLREQRWSQFHPTSKQRFGLLMDTGAPQSCVGNMYFERFVSCFALQDLVKWREHSARLSGIGEGAATCDWLVQIPVGLETGEGYWQTQLLEGIGEPVPPLLGLEPMTNRQAIIDLRDPNKTRVYKLNWTADNGKTETLKIYRVNGHLILPIDWGGTSLPNKNTFLEDPLGLNIYATHQQDDIPTDTTETATTNRAENCALDLENFGIFHDNEATKAQEFVAPALVPSFEPLLEPQEDASQDTPHTQGHAAVHATGMVKTARNDTHLENAAAHATHTVAHGRSYFGKQPNQKFDTAPNTQNETQGLHASYYGLLKQMRRNTKAISKLVMSNRTYQTKYKGLPLGSPVPPIVVRYTKHKQWHFWEWWAGQGNLTRVAEREHMTVGPPITWDTGWCLKLETHRQALKH